MTAPTLAPVSRSARTRRANRSVLALIGLLLFAGGAAGIAAGLGLFGEDIRYRKVIPEATRQWVYRHDWFWIAIAAGGVVVALLAFRWLFAQTATNRVSHLDLESDRRDGRTVLAARAVTDAVAEEIDSYRGVASVSAHLIGARAAPLLLTHVSLDERGDPAAVRTRIQSEAVPHTRRSLDNPDLPVRLELRLAGRSRRDLL